MDSLLQDNIPDDIVKRIYDCKAAEHEYTVYRIARNGIIEESVFDSTFTEFQKGINKSELDLTEIGTYSTSCSLSFMTGGFIKTVKKV
jgi:hypothetical protein